MGDACGNCGEILRGPYCHGCGQKRLGEGDRRLGHLLRQAFELLTDLDGRFWSSVRALLLHPGRLSRDYLDGRRQRWMTPLSLFLLANVVYFLAPGLSDFNLPLESQRVQIHSPLTTPWVEQRIAARDLDALARWTAEPVATRTPEPPRYTRDTYAVAYDAQSGNVGKALIAVHIPVLAFGLMLAFRRARLYFAEHLVVATHQFTFVLLYIQLVVFPAGWLVVVATGAMPPTAVKLALGLPMIVYFTLALRRVYACSWPAALLWPFVLNALVVVANLTLYRFLQFAITFAIT